jgi:hypothetical protein
MFAGISRWKETIETFFERSGPVKLSNLEPASATGLVLAQGGDALTRGAIDQRDRFAQ